MNNENITSGSLFDRIMQLNIIIGISVFAILIAIFLALFCVQMYDEALYAFGQISEYITQLTQ